MADSLDGATAPKPGPTSFPPDSAPCSRLMSTVETARELREQVARWRTRDLRVAFVPTMGALHEGHLSLVRQARALADRVVVSIFVNPAQFGPDEDYDAYPRDPERDCALLAGEGCSLLFRPAVETVYPPGDDSPENDVVVDVPGPSAGFEADERPGHFRGVATVVLKLLNLVQPDLALFGRKDAQQLAVVRRMAEALHLSVEIVAAPIVREDDGLALSSRNVYLSDEEREEATVLYRSLEAAHEAIEDGERDAETIRKVVMENLDAEPLGTTDYVAVVDARTFRPIETLDGECVVAIAYRLGDTRLLDNLHVEV